MNLKDELAAALWLEIERASVDKDYPTLHLLYSVLAKLRPIDFQETEREILRLMGVDLLALSGESGKSSCESASLSKKDFSWFDNCEAVEELCPTFTAPSQVVNVINEPNCEWAKVSPKTANQVTLRKISQARVVVGNSIIGLGGKILCRLVFKIRTAIESTVV